MVTDDSSFLELSLPRERERAVFTEENIKLVDRAAMLRNMWFARASYGDTFYISKARYSAGNDVRFAVGDLEIITRHVRFCAENAHHDANAKNTSGYYS